ncbi:hypothetical protein AAFF_G00272260 [Aldrovandia affinis]|uniref:XK-related protein n=1 Tax=Aldrovandia affinis TaxID=143900 RepID=A0AAD7RAS2_9TELE|nr:hypothetical protein AAFF_G00272260 [Aldrovandia affinis]
MVVISSSELEELAKPVTPKCTYFNMPHGSDSEPFQDELSINSRRSVSTNAARKKKEQRVFPSDKTNTLWTKKHGSLSSFASIEFKMTDNKVHPQAGPSDHRTPKETQSARAVSAASRSLKEQDSLEKLHLVCGQHCPILRFLETNHLELENELRHLFLQNTKTSQRRCGRRKRRSPSPVSAYWCTEAGRENSDHSGSAQGLHPGSQPDSGTGEGDFVNADSRCCGSSSTCLRLSREQQMWTVWDALWILAAIAVYSSEVATDVWLSVDYYLRRDYWWFGLTLFFMVLGSFPVQVFSFRWFVQDFSTEESSSAVNCSHVDGKLLSGSASHGDVGAHPSTPQRQASTASKSNIMTNSTNTTTNSTNSTAATRTKKRSTSLSICIWFMQSTIHILLLGQIWR